MTKIRVKLIIIVLLILSIIGVKTVNASVADFTVDSVKVKETVGTIDVVEPVFSSREITSNITFNSKGDAVTLELVIRNNNNFGYKVESISDNNTNANISISYEYDENYFYSKETKSIFVTLKYTNELINYDSVDIKDLKISIKYATEEEVKGDDIIIDDDIIINPTTGDNIYIYLFVITLALFVIIYLLMKLEKKYKIILCSLLLLCLIIIGIPFVINYTRSLEENEMIISFNDIVVKGRFEEYSINILDDDNNIIQTIIYKYGDVIGTIDPIERDGYTFVRWIDEAGEEVLPDTKVYDNMSIKGEYLIAVYTITYDLDGGTVSPLNPNTYTYEDETITLNNPTKEDYEFRGWTGSNGNKPSKSVKIKTHSTGDKSYVANWVPLDAVAEINGEFFTSIKKALDSIDTSDETKVTIIKSVSEQIIIPENRNIVLDATGYVVNNPCTKNTCSTIKNYGTLNIIGGTFNCDAPAGVINNYPNAVAIIDGADLNGTGSRQAVYNEGTLTIKGNSILTNVTSQRGAVQNTETGTMYIEDGTIIAQESSGVNNAGVLVIGKNDGVANSTPYIRGKAYGLSTSNNLKMYDGVLLGKSNGINSTIGDYSRFDEIEDRTTLKNKIEVVEGINYKEIYLNPTYTITLNPNGGSVSPTSLDVHAGEMINDLPNSTLDGKYFNGWYTELTGGIEIKNDYIPTSDMTLYTRWSDTDPFPVVFSQLGACTFNGAYNEMTGAECSAYADKTFIDTGINLFNGENIEKDFEIYMEIDNLLLDDPDDSSKHKTLIGSKDESGLVNVNDIVPGFVFRLDEGPLITYSIKGGKGTSVVSRIEPDVQSVRIVRANNKLYYSFNGEPLEYLSDVDPTFTYDAPLTFGATYNEEGVPFRFVKGTFKNIKVKMGNYYSN
ncbi:MAG: InlB B-repeat-containing protein [Bacilli bacterium]|nr:InlB B-repeat-containing protein [Bacilli bacterium]